MISLRSILNDRLNKEEVRTLCADLSVDYDNLAGEVKEAKIRELIDHLKKRHDLERLKSWLQQYRSDIEIPPNVLLSPAPPSPDERNLLLKAFHKASAELRTYGGEIHLERAGIAPIHLERAEVAQIGEWIRHGNPNERLGILLDQPGSGKTVVMRDVLLQLEADNIPVLAIKADLLSGIRTKDELVTHLDLPASIEECVHRLAIDGPVVILLDQLDALSLTLSRDQATLTVMLSLLARLREAEHVRIIASCRSFDLNNDPHLSTIKADRKFHLQPLNEVEVNRVLHALNIDLDRLLPAHRILLSTPLHLNIYASVVANEPTNRSESFRSLQELYEALWEKQINCVPPDRPDPTARINAIYRLVEYMQNNRQLTAPVAILDEYAEAARYLERVGFIRREKSNWLFIHQTLFDYCYARRFVTQGRSLSQDILSSSQGLFERSQMVQVLAYLRGSDPSNYRRELKDLLFVQNLRTHLRLLLIGWFGSLSDLRTDEINLARRLLQSVDDQALFLQASSGNPDWFDALNNSLMSSWLQTLSEERVDVVIKYLGSLIESRTSQVLAHLIPYAGRNNTWDTWIAYCLSCIKQWQNPETVSMLCDLLARGQTGQWIFLCMHHLSQSNPTAGCLALRAYLDRRLDELWEQEQVTRQAQLENPNAAYRDNTPDRLNWERYLFDELEIRELAKSAVQEDEAQFIKLLLPWFISASKRLSDWQDEERYPADLLFSWGWYGEHISEGPAFARLMAEGLAQLAQKQPSEFRALANELMSVESLAVHRLLATAYLVNPALYANDIFSYLITDRRRIKIGEILESPHDDSCRLYGAVFPHLDKERQIVLEHLILNLQPDWEKSRPSPRDITQLRFLKSVAPDLLSETAYNKLQELERKFPGFEQRPPHGIITVWTKSPIDQIAQTKMSDKAWIGAMRKYDDSTAWGVPRKNTFKGGVIELSRAFTEQVKKDPQRFYRLAQRFNETISLHYVQAAISGLAESDAPIEWVYDLVQQFAPRIEGEFRKGICYALAKRAEAGIPDDLLDLMTDWALHDPNPKEELWRKPTERGDQFYYNGDPLSYGINTVRGAAVQAVCSCALLRKPSQTERAIELLEKAANDPSTAVRTCVVERLRLLIGHDAECTLAIFERALDGHPELLQTIVAYDFLYHLYYHHFPRIQPFIETMLKDDDEATRQAGARLICLAAFQYPEATPLAEQAIQGDVAMRRGAAQVYAHNLGQPDMEVVCQENLLQLMQDPDEQVRKYVGECFNHIHPEQIHSLRSFIEAFLISPALPLGAEHLIDYLKPLAIDEHELILNATTHLLNTIGKDMVDIQKSEALLEKVLAQLPLIVYTHADDLKIKSRAIDVFEQLLLLGSWTAQRALEDWDRR